MKRMSLQNWKTLFFPVVIAFSTIPLCYSQDDELPLVFDTDESNSVVFTDGVTATYAESENAQPVSSTGDTILSPDDAYRQLVAGNARYLKEDSAEARELPKLSTAENRYPIATIIYSLDMPVLPTTLTQTTDHDVYLSGVTAGAISSDDLASVEYGVLNLQTPLLVVMGHYPSHDVSTIIRNYEALEQSAKTESAKVANSSVTSFPSGTTTSEMKMYNLVGPAIARTKEAYPDLRGSDLANIVSEALVWQSLETILMKSTVVQELVRSGKLNVIAAIVDDQTGKIFWLGEHPLQDEFLQPAPEELRNTNENSVLVSEASLPPALTDSAVQEYVVEYENNTYYNDVIQEYYVQPVYYGPSWELFCTRAWSYRPWVGVWIEPFTPWPYWSPWGYPPSIGGIDISIWGGRFNFYIGYNRYWGPYQPWDPGFRPHSSWWSIDIFINPRGHWHDPVFDHIWHGRHEDIHPAPRPWHGHDHFHDGHFEPGRRPTTERRPSDAGNSNHSERRPIGITESKNSDRRPSEPGGPRDSNGRRTGSSAPQNGVGSRDSYRPGDARPGGRIGDMIGGALGTRPSRFGGAQGGQGNGNRLFQQNSNRRSGGFLGNPSTPSNREERQDGDNNVSSRGGRQEGNLGILNRGNNAERGGRQDGNAGIPNRGNNAERGGRQEENVGIPNRGNNAERGGRQEGNVGIPIRGNNAERDGRQEGNVGTHGVNASSLRNAPQGGLNVPGRGTPQDTGNRRGNGGMTRPGNRLAEDEQSEMGNTGLFSFGAAGKASASPATTRSPIDTAMNLPARRNPQASNRVVEPFTSRTLDGTEAMSRAIRGQADPLNSTVRGQARADIARTFGGSSPNNNSPTEAMTRAMRGGSGSVQNPGSAFQPNHAAINANRMTDPRPSSLDIAGQHGSRSSFPTPSTGSLESVRPQGLSSSMGVGSGRPVGPSFNGGNTGPSFLGGHGGHGGNGPSFGGAHAGHGGPHH